MLTEKFTMIIKNCKIITNNYMIITKNYMIITKDYITLCYSVDIPHRYTVAPAKKHY